MLLLDRFLSGEGSALDLATGLPVRVRMFTRPTVKPPYSTRGSWRLIDSGPRSARVFVEAWARVPDVPAAAAVAMDSVRAALEDARDGCPRALDVAADDEAGWRRAALDIAREARLAGFVPVAVGVLGEVLRGNHFRCREASFR